MARGLRSSRAKVNKTKLRSKTFGPVEDARLERLSKKLVELSSSKAVQEHGMEVDAAVEGPEQSDNLQEEVPADAMNVDNEGAADIKAMSKKKTRTRKEARKIKRDSKRKPRNLIAFKTKTRNPTAKRRRPPRI